MLRGLYTVSTAMEQHAKGLNIISNNLANINTTGYKTDISMYEEFKSQLLYRIGGSPLTETSEPAKVNVSKNKDEYTLETSEGYFRINAVNGISYNKSVAFRRDVDGYLKTFYRNSNGSIIEGKGYKVLGEKGPINIPEGANIDFDKKGNLLIDGDVKDKLVFNSPLMSIGTMSGGIKLMRTGVDYSQGNLITTHNPLDLAISGKGYFVVKTPAGERYTRDGQFKLDFEGTLRTDSGYEVQGLNGKISGLKGNIGVNEFGEITSDGNIVDKLQIANPKRDEFLKKTGDNLYRYETELKEDEKEIKGNIIQGALEGSNVNPVKEMVKMIELYRDFESAQRVVKAYDDNLSKAVTEIGRI